MSLKPFSGRLWLVPLVDELHEPPTEFGEPIPIGEVQRAARHHVLRNFHLYEDDGACDHDILAVDQTAPLWGRAVFGHGQEQLDLLDFVVWDVIDHEALVEVHSALGFQHNALRR